MKFKPRIVPINSVEADEKLFVREMSWRERKCFEESVGLGNPEVDQDNPPHFAEKLLAYSVCDAEGNLIFGNDALDSVLDLPASVFWKLFRESQKLNTLSDANVETATKN